MATLVLSAVGSAVGGSLGGSVFGIAASAIGKAVGATLGSAIDQSLLGTGSAPVESGRVDRFRVLGAAEGEPIARIFGRMRVPGHVIWASRFLEQKKKTTTGSKASKRTVVEYSYSVSLALALCEGKVSRISRIWADGNEILLSDLNMRLHKGGANQLTDSVIAAIEDPDPVPAYRDTAYLVIEDLDLGPYGNRIPQFNVEVIRDINDRKEAGGEDPYKALKAVALMPGSGEYTLATTEEKYDLGGGRKKRANVNNAQERSDFGVGIENLITEMPEVKSTSLVVSWFGTDLRCDRCDVLPKVEQTDVDGIKMPWHVSSVTRNAAEVVSRHSGKPAFGGTPTDQSVFEAIKRMNFKGLDVMFYPFVLMDVPKDNGKPDPWGGGEQAVYPWRGRITLDVAPGLAGSVDKTAAAAAQVAAFFGQADPGDFTPSGDTVGYTGPNEWSYRRFILHYAHLCKLAGGVESFCIGSELVALTRIRDSATTYPAVEALRALASDVRSILGSGTKIGYAADWSEYFGHHPNDGTGDVFFHLDPLWGDPEIDFVGIDNYMPLSDWRDHADHADADAGSLYDLGYLTGNVAGGEGYDWYYADSAAREAQTRTGISDTAYGEDWVFRYKDILNWWASPHHNRPGGVRDGAPTAWQPQSKPVRFTEFGCPAIDKGTNQPNVFLDPKSSESFAPYFSTRAQDDFIQYRYYQAHFAHWAEPANNPVSSVYGKEMVDIDRCYAWAWDTRPWPDFPDRDKTWGDAANYPRGHWISGRTVAAPISSIVAEIAKLSGLSSVGCDDLYGSVSGYAMNAVQTGRQALQPLMLTHGFDAVDDGAELAFRSRAISGAIDLDPDRFVDDGDRPVLKASLTPEAETPGRVVLDYYAADADYQTGAAEAEMPDVARRGVAKEDAPAALRDAEARAITRRWISETELGRERVSFALPPEMMPLTVGDRVTLPGPAGPRLYRIDSIEDQGVRQIEAVRIDDAVYRPGPEVRPKRRSKTVELPAPPIVRFLDLPLLTGAEVPHAPHVAVAGQPWTGPVAVFSDGGTGTFKLVTVIGEPSAIGTTLTDLPFATPGRWSHAPLDVVVDGAPPTPHTAAEVLNGANAAAIRLAGSQDWEVLQYRDADIQSETVFRLNGFLRGQFGTDSVAPQVYPVGSEIVFLDGGLTQIDLKASERGLLRSYRIGPASSSLGSDSFVDVDARFDGVGLRPLSPVHLRAARLGNGDCRIDWIRRTRIDGDSWLNVDVPLGETYEAYAVTIRQAGQILRTVETSSPHFVYTAADQAADGATVPFDVEVAQISDQFGPGLMRRTTVDV